MAFAKYVLFAILFTIGSMREELTIWPLKYCFESAPDDVLVQMAKELNSVNESRRLNHVSRKIICADFSKDIAKQLNESSGVENLNRGCCNMFMKERLKYEQYTDAIFAALPRRNIISKWKCAQLKDLFWKLDAQAKNRNDRAWLRFRTAFKKLVRPEKQEAVLKAIEEEERSYSESVFPFVTNTSWMLANDEWMKERMKGRPLY